LLLGCYWHNITFVDINTCPAANFAKGSDDSFYLDLVNREFGWNIQLTDLTDEQPRIVQRIQRHLGRGANASEPRFNHYRPARYLSENLESLAEHLSDWVLERFEHAFVKLNELQR